MTMTMMMIMCIGATRQNGLIHKKKQSLIDVKQISLSRLVSLYHCDVRRVDLCIHTLMMKVMMIMRMMVMMMVQSSLVLNWT